MVTYYIKSKDSVLHVATLACKAAEESGRVELQALGNSCVSTAMKSATRALGKLMLKNIPAAIDVSHGSTECDGKQMPTVRLVLKTL